MIIKTLLLHRTQVAGERRNGHPLQRNKRAKVQLAAKLAHGSNHIRTTYQEGEARAGHIEGLGEGEELHAHLFGALVRQERATLVPIKNDVRIGIIVHNEQIVRLGKGHQLLIKLRSGYRTHWVCRQRHHHIAGLISLMRVNAFQVGKEVMLGSQGIKHRSRPCEMRSTCEDGIARIWHQHRITGICQRHRQVGHALLGARDHHHHVGRDFNIETTLVVGTHRIQKFRQVMERILPRIGIFGRLQQRIDNLLRRRKIRGSHRQVDHGLAPTFQRTALGIE